MFHLYFFLLINIDINNNEESYLDDKWIVWLLLRLFEMYTKKNKDEIEETRKKISNMRVVLCHLKIVTMRCFSCSYIYSLYLDHRLIEKKKRKESKHVKW